MSLTVTNPSYDRVYTMYAWRDNNNRLVLTQGEGATTLDGTVTRIKAPRFQLRDDQGVMNLSGSPVISLALTRPDKSEDLLACTIIDAANGIVSCPITASATAIAGQAVGEIRLSSTNGTIKFFGVHALIYDGVSNSAAAQSTQFSALVDALQKVATVDPDGSNTVTLDSAIVENGTNPVASGVIYAALQVLDNAKIDKDKAVKYTGSNDLSECVDNGVLYRVHDGTMYQILLCNSGDAYRVQYMFKRSGEVVFRTSAKSNDTWGAWSTWSPIGTTSNIADGAVTTAKVADDLAEVINAKEVKSNKKTTLTGNESSNDFYPTTKAVADAIKKLEAIPRDVKLAMDTLFSKAAYADDDAASSYATFHAWAISSPVTSITTVFTQGSATIYDTDSLDTLKQYLTVTATYSDSTTATVTDYTLSGALEVGTSVITVTYNGKTDSFNVNVTASVSYIYDGTTSNASWMDNNSIKGVPFSKYTLVAKYSVSGKSMIDEGAAPVPMGGRATSRTQIITRVHDGQTVGLTSYVLSTSATVAYSLWYGYIDANDNTFNGSQCISTDVNYTASSWLSNSVVLPTNARKIGERFLMIGFKKGDGTTEFTATELAELQTLISIT